MSKIGKQKRRKTKRKRKPHLSKKLHRWRKKQIFSVVWKICAGVLGLLSAIVGIHSYSSSRIFITPTSPIDIADSFSTPFIISSDGYLAVRGVNISCLYSKAIDINGSTLTNVGADMKDFAILEANHPITVQCNFIHSNTPIVRADMTIEISYRPSFMAWWKDYEDFRYIVERGSDGVLHWLPQSNVN